jgi:hypothetical protein
MSIKRLFQIMFGLFFLFIITLGILAALLFINQQELEKSEKLRYDLGRIGAI